MPTIISTSKLPLRGNFGGILEGIFHLPDALKKSPSGNVVLGVRVSGLAQIHNSSLQYQIDSSREAIIDMGGNVCRVVGDQHAQNGKLSTGRLDLVGGVVLANCLDAILCYWDMTRLFRPDAYDPPANPYCPYTQEDFDQLHRFVGNIPYLSGNITIALIVPPETPVAELRSLAIKHGQQQAKKRGRRPGRPCEMDVQTEQRVICDWRRGDSFQAIADRYGRTKSAVQRCIDRVTPYRNPTISF